MTHLTKYIIRTNEAIAKAAQPPPPASLTSILTSFRQSGEGDRELLLSILSAKKAEEERLTSLIQTRLTILQARLSLHSAVAAAVPPTLAEMERTPSLTSSISGEGNSPTGVMTVTPMPIPFGYVPPVQAGGQASESISNGRENEKDERGDRTLPLPDPNPSYRSRAQAQSHSRSRSGSRSPNALHQPRLPFIQNLVSATNNDESKAHSLYSHHSGQSRKRYDPCEFALPLEGLGRSRSSRSRSPRDGNASESGRVRERGGLEMLLDVGMGIEREGRESDERE